MQTSPALIRTWLASLMLLLVSVAARAAEPSMPTADPGLAYPATSDLSDQKAGSVLFYNFYTSDASNPAQDTLINITNTSYNGPDPLYVHLFFVDSADCLISDVFVCLTPTQTASFRASANAPGETGYLLAVAVDVNGCPISHNFLIGSADIKLASGHHAKLNAVALAALYTGTLPGCTGGATAATLAFDGVVYNRVPRTLALSSIADRPTGNQTLLVINRFGGNLTGAIPAIGPLSGILYNDAESAFSFTSTASSCQFRSLLPNGLSNSGIFDTIIPAGRTGWMKLSAGTDIGLMGAAINFNPNTFTQSNAFNGGANLHHLTLTSSSYTIPVLPASCPPLAQADLALTKTGAPNPVSAGGNLTYTLTATNNGVDNAEDLFIFDPTPPNTTFVSAMPSAGGTCTTPPVGSPGDVTCTFLGATPASGTRSVVIVVNVNAATPIGATISNTATVNSSTPDPIFSNNTATTSTNVICGVTAISPVSQSFPAAAATGIITVTAASTCSWSAVSSAPWLIVTGGSGASSGTVSYSLAANTAATPRSATITIGGRVFTALQGAQFNDVPQSHPYYTFIGKLSARGITQGCGSGNFCPDANVTREQMAIFIERALGVFSPPPGPGTPTFQDVGPDRASWPFVEDFVARGISNGCAVGPPRLYCPDANVTREQIAIFLIRALGVFSPPTPAFQRFGDVPPSRPGYAFIEEMFVRGITTGCSTTPLLYCPDNIVTRSQMAAFLVRAFNL